MKFLLFFISLIFSLIFYIFHWLSKWKDIFWERISNSVDLVSFSNNLLIESFVFLSIWIIFLYSFSNIKSKSNSKLLNYKYELIYFIFYIIFIYSLYFFNFLINYILLILIILFIFSDVLFNYISNINIFSNNKSKIRQFGLILNYSSSIISIIYIFKYDVYIIPILILLFNIVFNILIHKKYTNYISLLVSIINIWFIFYFLYFLLIELYIYYI